MFAYIKGKLAHKEATYCIIEVMGIGYFIRIPLSTYSLLPAIENTCQLFTYLAIKEEAHTLYGFHEISEKKLFTDLISVSGVGPNTGIVMLSTLSAKELQTAIVQENVGVIQGIKGIGSKTAQKVIIELKDKLKKDEWAEIASREKPIFGEINPQIKNDALAALVVMGVSRSVAEKSIQALLKTNTDITLEELIKQALR